MATTDATVPDGRMTEPIHIELARPGLLPGEHLLDSGYPSAQLVCDSHRRWGIALVTPLLADQSRRRRLRPGRVRRRLRHPAGDLSQGQLSTWCNPVTQRGTDAIVIKFAAQTWPRPGPHTNQPMRTVRTVVIGVSTLLVVFAATYSVISNSQPNSFSEPLSRTDALCFTLTVFATEPAVSGFAERKTPLYDAGSGE